MAWVRWTDEMDSAIRTSRGDGKSAAAIAKLMGKQFGGIFTRNSILGRANRVGMPKMRNERKGAPRQTNRPRKRREIYRPTGPSISLVEAAPPESERIKIDALTSHTCHFVIDEPRAEDTQYCGRETIKRRDIRQSYCVKHYQICHDTRRDPKGSKRPSKFKYGKNYA